MRRVNAAVTLIAALALMLGAPGSYALAGDGGVWSVYGAGQSAPEALRPAHAPAPAVAAATTRIGANAFARSAATHPAAAARPSSLSPLTRDIGARLLLHAAQRSAARAPACLRAPPRRT